MLTVYGYGSCDTCRKAKKALAAGGLVFEDIDITVHAPPVELLQAILERGDYVLSDLLNRSGVQYRELNMKEKLESMKEAEVLSLLASNGRLCKRPIVSDGARHTVGYDAARFAQVWKL